jgi:hypothetical protein
MWACTKMACPGRCVPGESKTADDECNTCMCMPKDITPSGTATTTDADTATTTSPCEQCLEEGGTWQPEANTCTTDCDIMDISCYTESCPKGKKSSGPWLCTDLPRCEPETCPEAEPFLGSCVQMIAWAKNPATGKCCRYSTPCVVPASMGETYGSKKACQQGGAAGVGGGPDEKEGD